MIIICITTTSYNKLWCVKRGKLPLRTGYMQLPFKSKNDNLSFNVLCLPVCKHCFITSNILLLKLQTIATGNFLQKKILKLALFCFFALMYWNLYICVYIYMQIYTHAHTYIRVYIHTKVFILVFTYIYKHAMKKYSYL